MSAARPAADGSRLQIVVVGGGMAGVSIARELAAGARVVLLEREAQLAYHTTGRSAAMYLQSYGNQVVRRLTLASREDFDALERDLAGSPLLTPHPLLWTADAKNMAALRSLLETGAPLRELPAPEALAMCPGLRPERLAGAALDTSSMEIDVHAVHQAYVRGLRARGGEVRASAPLLGLARTGDGWRVSIPGEDLRADVVVNASGAWADELAAMAGAAPTGLRPLRRTIFTSPVRWGSPIDAWPFVVDVADRFYFKAEHDQVLVSPADEVPDSPRDARPEEVDIARAMAIVNEFTRLELRSVRSAWAGLRSFVADRSPVAGARTSEPGFFWFAGQGGYGIQMAPALARAGASLLLEGRLPADISGLGVSADDLSPDRGGLSGERSTVPAGHGRL